MGLAITPFIVIDRGFWEYYQDNDEIRQAVVIHELGHCDLKQNHGDNAIMDIAWEGEDDLLILNSRTIDWQPLYEKFFVMQQRDRKRLILCSNENKHLYETCSSLEFEFQRGSNSRDCPEEEENCYMWRDDFTDGLGPQFSFLIESLGF